MKTNTHTNKAQQNEVIPAGYKNTKLGVIPEDWEVKRLGDVCNVNPNRGSLPSEFRYIDLSSVESGKLLRYNNINASKAPSRAKRLLEKNDILFQTVRPYQKNNLFFEENEKFKYVASTGFAVLKSNYCNNFLYQYIYNSHFNHLVLMKCTGTSYPAINSEELKTIKIPLPPLPEQKKIADILTTWDKAIDQIENLIANTKLQKKYLMQELLTGATRFNEFKTANNRYKETKLGRIPEDWEVVLIENCTICLDNKRIPLNNEQRNKIPGKYPYWGANGIQGYINNYIFDEPIILLAEDGGNFHDYENKKIANISYGKCWVNNHAHVLKSMQKNKIEFIYYALVHKNILAYVNSGTRTKLNKSDLLKIPLALPPLPEQKKIAAALSTIDQEIEQLTQQQEIYKQEKKYLMQQLLTGATRVRVD